MRRSRRRLPGKPIYPTKTPSYLLPPAAREVVFDPSLRRACEVSGQLS